MGSNFLPRLVNDPFDDPALFVPFRYEKRALLFDLGDITALSARDILKITHIFVTHTHMDHFAGFDRVLRLLLGRNKDLYMYGPPGFLANVAGKLAGYTWNLVASYENRFTLHATELHPDRARMVSHPCRKAFSAADPVREIPFDGIVIKEPALTVRAIHLDHGIPVLAFALEERFHINIVKDRLSQLGLLPGPWLNRFKSMLYCDADPEATIAVSSTNATETALQMPIRALKHAIARISPGQRLAYIVDVGGTPENLKRITDFAAGVDHLFVEAAFAHIHHEIAIRKNHLTARQAGALARSCRVKQYSLFHFSPRYTHCPDMLEAEAKKAFTKGSSIVGDG